MRMILHSRGLGGRLALAMLGFVLASIAGVMEIAAPAAAPPVLDPDRVVVSEVIIQGSHQVPIENIKNQLKTRVGKEFNANQLQEDVCGLFASQQFANVWADKQDDGPHRVKVVIYIKDLPSMVQKITYKGNINLSDSELDEITNLRKGMPLNPIANKVACQAIMKRFNEDGRLFASCNLLKGGEAGDTEIVFNIYEGPKIHVRDIQFTGNTFVSGAVLKNRINSSAMLLGLGHMGVFNRAMADNDVANLIEYYRSFGYHDVKVNLELVYTGDGREVTLIFHIQEGVRYRVTETPQVAGVKSVTPEVLESFETMQHGEFYDEGQITKDRALITNHIGYRGQGASIRAETVWPQDQSGMVQVDYEVVENPSARVGQIYIVGNEYTPQNIILEQLPLHPGQILTYSDLKQAEKNLARLNIFKANPASEVTVLDNPADPDNPVKDILVTVKEANTARLRFGLGVNSSKGLIGSIQLNERIFDLFRPSSTAAPTPAGQR